MELGDAVLAVVPLNRLVPAAMLAVMETSFHDELTIVSSLVTIPESAPEIFPVVKSTVKFAFPIKSVKVLGTYTRPCTVPIPL